MSQPHPLRVGVVGVGYLGRFHALIYARLAQVELVGVCDTNAERAATVAAEAGCAAWDDPLALIGRVDAVSIAVPTSAHHAVACAYLEQGVHVLLEKPLAVDAREGAEIVRLAEQQAAVLQVGHLERFNAGVMALAARIDRPRYIEAQRMGGFVERATDVDVVADLMIHDLDIILALVDAELVDVRAVGTPVLTPRVDIASARLEFSNGTVANAVASRVSDKKTRRIRVFQSQGYLSLDFIGQTLDSAVPEQREAGQRPEIQRARVMVEPVQPLDRELEAFIHCVKHRARPLVDGRTGLRALEVALQVQASIADQQRAISG
ncbi:MAG: Gfo/Idh/MocA family oxidoreductase [Lamprobacter sp.]|uniref:Gfo/Idh/MocA family oxidoreductase n=1 Tax=Lamprobacter sp. TaxID=3100796 RepID=UPI002B25CC02|nr:Gfo/Idh/MocA family oxidoreductase [Lamprobacter sp.]MEA3640352.1 Gfo/Idh/MocA family oxidoreductase [Lamprobacter sp.]